MKIEEAYSCQSRLRDELSGVRNRLDYGKLLAASQSQLGLSFFFLSFFFVLFSLLFLQKVSKSRNVEAC